ncbi:uncharacterized protein LOC119591826 [Penaeus monodon]|uniref:uncharacterized protein LOC119591826 n=1 Tax=Penaeus monodon TaxID=6687 RepID=UPI0018A79219|nr:uncharacterized protein LOC119591826 [Penaeus monodon]
MEPPNEGWTGSRLRDWSSSTSCELYGLLDAVSLLLRTLSNGQVIRDSQSVLRALSSTKPEAHSLVNNILHHLVTAIRHAFVIHFLCIPSHVEYQLMMMWIVLPKLPVDLPYLLQTPRQQPSPSTSGGYLQLTSPQLMSPQPMPLQPMPQQLMPLQRMSPQLMQLQLMSPQPMPLQRMSPQPMPQQQMSPQLMPQQQMLLQLISTTADSATAESTTDITVTVSTTADSATTGSTSESTTGDSAATGSTASAPSTTPSQDRIDAEDLLSRFIQLLSDLAAPVSDENAQEIDDGTVNVNSFIAEFDDLIDLIAQTAKRLTDGTRAILPQARSDTQQLLERIRDVRIAIREEVDQLNPLAENTIILPTLAP